MNRRFFMRGLNHQSAYSWWFGLGGGEMGRLQSRKGYERQKKKFVCYAGNTYATRCAAQTNIYDRLFSNNSNYVSYIKQHEQFKKFVTANTIAH